MMTATPALLGVGLLEAIRVEDLLENEAMQLAGGHLRREERDGVVYAGRFGWSADAVSVEEQVRRALEREMGVEPSTLPEGALERLVDYVRLLAVPAPRAEDLWAMPGAGRFDDFSCTHCHLDRSYVTGSHPLQSLRSQTIRPLSDLLVHDLGQGETYRTTPLWGLGLKTTVRGETRYWHDDSASSLEAAIELHGGEAENSRAAFRSATPEEQEALLEFLQAL